MIDFTNDRIIINNYLWSNVNFLLVSMYYMEIYLQHQQHHQQLRSLYISRAYPDRRPATYRNRMYILLAITRYLIRFKIYNYM